jgi:phage terminase large subunit-like protein
MPVEILGRHGFLEPADIERLDTAPETDRLDGVVGVVGVDHQADVRPDRVAHRLRPSTWMRRAVAACSRKLLSRL